MKKRKLFLGVLLASAIFGLAACDGPDPDKNNDDTNPSNTGEPGEQQVTKYTVTFNSNGGTNVQLQEIVKDGKVTKPANPTKAEDADYTYTFAGWYKDAALTQPYNFADSVTANITLYAKWDAVAKSAAVEYFTVSFNTNGGSEIQPQEVEVGGKATEPTAPTKTEDANYTYTFAGWYKDADLTEEFDFNSEIITTTVIYAKWNQTSKIPPEADKFIVTFVSNGGTSISAQQITSGGKATEPTAPTKAADAQYTYAFAGWYKDEGLTEEYDFNSEVTEAVTLYAKWTTTTNKYLVTFVSNGGTSVSAQNVEYGSKVETPTAPTRAADAQYTYAFAGWYKDEGLTEAYNFDSEVTTGLTLYAKWTGTVNEYAVTFVTNGGTEVTSQNVAYGSKVVTPTAPTKAADAQYTYAFAGWYKDAGLTEEYDFNSEVTEAVTLYAKWNTTTNEYIVSFVTNGGTAVTSQNIAYGSKVTKPADPSKEATADYTYTFAGWYKDAELTTPFDFDAETITSATTIYANWNVESTTPTPNSYIVTFNTNGGSAVDAQTIEEGGKVTAPTSPTKTADAQYTYTFAGWYKDAALTEEFDFNAETINAATTIYAKWTETTNQYLITFVSNGGTAVSAQYVEYGSKVDEPTDPTKEATSLFTYEFAGWYSNSGLTTVYDFDSTVTGALTLYAKWNSTPKVEIENIGYGTGYVAFTTLSASFTGKDSKNRPQLETDLTVGNFTFRTKSVLDGSTLNTQGKAVDVILPTQGSISLTGTWGSGDAGKVYVYKVVGDTEILIYTSSTSYSSKDAVSLKFESMSLEAGTYRINGLKDSNTSDGASIVISQIYYETIVEKVTVSYVGNNDQTIASTQIRKGTALSALPTLNDKSGFKFIGWYTDPDFTQAFDINAKIDSDITLYAKWEELSAEDIITISFNVNVDGKTIDSVQIEKGTKLLALPVLDIEGYRLEGWFTNSTFTQALDISTYTFNADSTIYAEYIKTYNVTFLDKDGNLIKTVTVDTDTKVTESISKPYYDGFKFDHWAIDGTETEFDLATEYIAANYTLRAVYVEDTNPVAKINITSAKGMDESASITFDKYMVSSNVYADSYNLYLGSKLLTEKDAYVATSGSTIKAELFGLTSGNQTVTVIPVFEGTEITAAQKSSTFAVTAYDRSGYAHFNNTEGVGAYNDDGTLKDNAIVLYVTDENKNTINLSFHDSVNNKDYSVTGIGNILNSAGKDNGTGKNSKGGAANTNNGCILALAQNNIPLVVRFVGCVSNSGLYTQGTFNANSTPIINGLTQYDGLDWGGSTGDNGHMARMQSGKNITFEGVGDDAIIDGWGFHLICESAYPQYAKNFEVRNLTFMNTPEDAVGMEGQETESTLTITASVERCWVHHNTFLAPSISSPAESDKSEGDGSCDFKRGRYFTCSYNYFENCHKTNLVGSSSSSVQYCLTYHHNIWYQCAARQPLARRANIHFYNNLVIGTGDTVASMRANCYMYTEKNYYLGCSRVVEYKTDDGIAGTAKSYDNKIIGCYNAYDATEVTDRETPVNSDCKDTASNVDYVNFDTNPNLFYYDSVNKKSDCYLTDANQARIDCIEQSGSRYRTVLGNCVFGTSTDITSTTSSATISGTDSLTIAKGKGVLKVFTVTAPVTCTMAATSNAGFDTGYLVKMDGTVMLELSTSNQTAVLLPGKYVVLSSVAFTSAGKNDKETTITTCTFAPYDSEELNQQLINQYNAAADAIPATIEYSDEHYQLIKAAMNAYNALGDLQSQVSYTKVSSAYADYKSLGEEYVENLIGQIELPITTANSGAVITARSAYNALLNKISDATVSNYSTLTTAEAQMSEMAVDIFLANVDAIPATITYSSECNTAIANAETAYASLDETQVKLSTVVTAYNKVVAARAQYNSLEKVSNVNSLIAVANSLSTYAEAYTAYSSLSSSEKEQVVGFDTFAVNYTIALIDELPTTITLDDGTTIAKARELYDSISSSYQANVTNYNDLVAAETAYNELASSVIKWSYDGQYTSDLITASGNQKTTAATFGSDTYSKGLKLESSSGSISFTLSSARDIVIYQTGGNTIKFNGTAKSVTGGSGTTIHLEAGSYTITKGDGSAIVYAIEIL